MTLGLVDLVLAQEVDAELRVRGIQIGLELDGLTKQLDRFAIAPRDHVEMRLRLVDLTVRRVVRERALDPRAFRTAVQQIERGVERIDLERRKALRLDDLERLVEPLASAVERSFLEMHAREEQQRLDVVRVGLEHLADVASRAILE